ncbi:helix-turn-helix domain-containing protein [Actinomadura rudentiformis]|uniref:Helix-turn-helix transcriptional regulator n=1 Tax=Actinomadura rudentiformis TaxID=359158 RepID=A0A6H9YK79_9ACTN|nr:helix-turn-helix transcriptional regulator [Actinomadura rudentiformis]KAB2344823.1 helix-turn-helix transcriptional regulator [Actinomadura rudentiformis]
MEAITTAIPIAYTGRMAWWDYVQQIAGSNQTKIAERTGLSQAGVSAWQSRTPKPETVTAFAHAYNRPVLEAFVAAGFLTADEAGVKELTPSLAKISSGDLLAELSRRLGVN